MRTLRRIGLTALMLAGFAQAGFAQTAEQSYLTMSLEELLDVRVTSVSKTEKAIRDAPVMAFVITRSMIQQRCYRDLLDLLADLPGIHVVNFACTEHAASEIFVRGVSANRKLIILVDGHKINPPTGEPFTFLRNIPLVSVRQVEFSYGSSSSLYGADAMAGIVNIVTRTGDHSPPTRLELSGGTHATREAQLSIGHRFPSGVKFAISGKYHESDVEDLPEHFPDVFRGYDVDLSEHSHNLHIKAEYKGFHLSYYRLRGSRNNAISFKPSLYDYSGDCVWQILNQFYTLDYDWDIAQHWSTKTLIAHSSTELRPPSTYTTDFSGNGNYTPHYFDWEGISTRFAQELHCNWEPVCMVLGGEIESFESTPKTELDNPLGEYNLDYENWGLFSQVEYEPNESLEFTAGLRYDHSSRYEDVWNPRLGAVCKPSSSVRLRGNWGTSYLAPVPHKVYERWGVIEDGEFVHLPNEDLRPEKLTSCEIGCGLFPTDDLLLEFAAFRIDCEDLMRIAFKGPITIDGKDLLYQTNENVAESEIWGAHVVADHQVTSQLRFDGHYTLTTGKQDAADIDSTEVDLNHMPKHMLEANATITHPWAELRLEGNWFDEITTHELNPGHAGACIDGAWTFDLTLSKRLNVGGTALGLALTVNNLFDKEYYKVPSTDEFFFSLPMVGQYRRAFLLTLTLGR